jgi:chromosome partitioning protein
MTKIITVTNQKGGVGKTTTTTTLAHGLALAGKRALIVDFDPQGQVAELLNAPLSRGVFDLLVGERPPASLIVEARERLDVITGDKSTATAQTTMMLDASYYTMEHLPTVLKPVMSEYDYVIIDTSPSVGGLQERAIWAADWVLIPTATEYLSLTSVSQTVTTMNSLKGRGWKGVLLGIIPTFYDEKTRESQESLESLKENFPQSTLTPIHRATVLREAADGRTVFERSPESRAAQEYKALVDWLMAQ